MLLKQVKEIVQKTLDKLKRVCYIKSMRKRKTHRKPKVNQSATTNHNEEKQMIFSTLGKMRAVYQAAEKKGRHSICSKLASSLSNSNSGLIPARVELPSGIADLADMPIARYNELGYLAYSDENTSLSATILEGGHPTSLEDVFIWQWFGGK